MQYSVHILVMVWARAGYSSGGGSSRDRVRSRLKLNNNVHAREVARISTFARRSTDSWCMVDVSVCHSTAYPINRTSPVDAEDDQ